MKCVKLVALLLGLILFCGCTCAVAEGDPWICPECGNENTTKFCTKCGARKPDEIVCPGCGAHYPFDTDVVFCGECGTRLIPEETVAVSYVSVSYEGEGFDTPEDAALCYLAGLKNMDFNQMLSAFAWETQAECFDYKAMITRAKGTDPTYVPGMPAANNLLLSANVELIRDSQIIYICRAIENYVNDELYASITGALPLREASDLDGYLKRCNNGKIEKIASMSNIRFYTPDDVTDGKFSYGKNPQSFIKQTAQYGADEAKVVFIAVDIDDKTYAVSPTVVRYEKKWYVVSVGSMVSSILGIESNKQAFFELPENLMEELSNVTPYSIEIDLSPSNKNISYEGEGFRTPYEAVACYYEGLKNGNVQQMMRAFAWETQADRYSLKDYVERMFCIYYDSPIRMQLDNAFMDNINLGSLRYCQGKKIYNAVRQYVLEDEETAKDLVDGYRVNLQEGEEIDAFIRAFDNDKAEKLEKLGNIRLIDPATVIERFNSDSVSEQMEMKQRIYGADEIMETFVVADLEGETLVFNPVLVRYGDKWYIATVEGIAFSMLGIDANHQALLHVKGSAESLLLLLK